MVVLPPPDGPIITSMFFGEQEKAISMSKYFNFFLKEAEIVINGNPH
jgi:hypothetical protein